MTEMIPRHWFKWISLIVLVIQNASTILLLRYIRTVPGDMFFSTTAIVCQEILKIMLSIIFLLFETNNFTESYQQVNQYIFHNYYDSLKTGIPAFLYTIQNNLIYLAISNLDAAIFQVTFQIKILTTAIFMVTILRKKLNTFQWISLVILFVGVATIQIQNVKVTNEADPHKNALFGLVCVVIACVLSGLAGVYFEMVLKSSPVSIWIRNIQLGVFGTIFAFITVYASDGRNVNEKGFFFGYNNLVWLNIFIQSFGGLLVAIVIKFADNILKGFATSIAIVVSCIASVYLFNTQIDKLFVFGTFMVVSSTLLYSYVPPSSLSPALQLNKNQQSSGLESVVIVKSETLSEK